jgi:hypothetical protein
MYTCIHVCMHVYVYAMGLIQAKIGSAIAELLMFHC